MMPSSLPQKILAIFAVIAGLAIGSHGETKSTATPPCSAMQQLGSDVSKELVVYPSQLAFGAHDVGTATVPQELTLCNNTEKQLDITHALSPADDFVVSPDCDALTPGVACALGISFRPKPTLPDEFRDVPANLTLTFKIGNDTKTETIPLTGRAALALVAEPNYLSFPPQVIGTTSRLRPIKLTNYKDFPIKLSRFSASAGFAIADRTDCDKLEVKSSCTITISFSPQVKRDVYGVVTVSYGADESTSSTSAGDNSKNSSAGNAKKTSPDKSPGTLIVSLQGRGTARPGWMGKLGKPQRAIWWSFWIAFLYFLGIVITRWNMIAKPNRNLCWSQIKVVRSRLDEHPDLQAKKPNLATMLTEAEKSISKFSLLDFLFWTRGQESAAWGQIHEVELQLINVTPLEETRASLEVAEQDLRHIGTPTASTLADRIHETLQADTSVPIRHWLLLLQQVCEAVGQTAGTEASIVKEDYRDRLRNAVKFLSAQDDLSKRIEEAIQGSGTTPPPNVGPLATDVVAVFAPATLKAAKDSLEPCPDGFPAEWEAARKATVAFLASAMGTAADVQAVVTTDPGLAQNQPLLQAVKDLLASQAAVRDLVNPILSDTSATPLSSLVKIIQETFTRITAFAEGVKNAVLEAIALAAWRQFLEDINARLVEAATLSNDINARDPSQVSARDLRPFIVFLSTLRQDGGERLKSMLGSAAPPMSRWRALLLEATQLIYDYRDTNYDTLASWQNKASWLVGCGILLIVSLSALIPNAIFFLVGAAGGYLSRLGRELKREDVPSDYGASWSTIFLSPVVGAITGWAGLLLAIMLARLGILGSALELDWNHPMEPVALGMAFLLGFSERLFDSVLSKLETGIFKPSSTTDSTAPLTITTSTLPAGKVGQDYKDQNMTLKASGGTPGYTWVVASGSSLPKDLKLDTSGALSGIPAAKTDSNNPAKVTIQVTDSAKKTASKEFTIAINA